MINFGTIYIKDKNSIVEARNKILNFVKALEFDSVSATRIATVTSELSRDMAEHGQSSKIKVCLKEIDGRQGLGLRFISKRGQFAISTDRLGRIFDKVDMLNKQGDECIDVFRKLSDDGFKTSDDFIFREKEKIERRTVGELYMELKETNGKLMNSAKMIQSEKMNAMGTLVAGVAHELNNPMTGMINYVQYCRKHTDSGDKRYKALVDTEAEIRRCIDIVNNLLTFSRIEKEGKESFRETDCAEIIERVLRLLSYRIEKNQVSVTKQYEKGTMKVWAKVNNIQQVFLNLVSNALYAVENCETREIHLSINPKGSFTQITVKDSGIGISSENRGKIFDPFFTTKPVGEGTGLGLSILKSIIDDHGGNVTCKSDIGKGTEFKVLLPMKTEKEMARE